MKTYKILSLIILCLALIMGCTNEEELLETLDDLKLKKASNTTVIHVVPTGVNDNEVLKNAFEEAKAAGPGTVVQLCEGTYHLDMLQVHDFNGTLCGAGKGKTILTHVDYVNYDEVNAYNLFPVLLKFVGGDVCIRNLSFMTKEENTNWFAGLIGFFGYSPMHQPNDWYINVKVDNIEVIGNRNDVGYGLMTGTDSRGMEGGVPFCKIDITVTNSYFADCVWYGACIMMIAEGKVTVGSKNGGNTFIPSSSWSYGNLGIWHFVNTKISVEGNHFEGQLGRCGGLDILSSPYLDHHAHSPQKFASLAMVQHNTFELSGFRSAAIIVDNRRPFYPDDEPMMVQVKNNLFTAEGGMSALRCFQLSGAVFRNNTFRGALNNGITLGGVPADMDNGLPEVFGEDGLLLGNNFSNASFQNETVFLNSFTRDWTIMGGHIGNNVVDMGENNLITGMNINSSDMPPGQTFVDNLQEMKGPMHSMNNK